VVLVSPSEPKSIKLALKGKAIVHPLPEEYGADFLLVTGQGRAAVQRKTWDDLLASLEDGRLAKELLLMKRAQVAVLVVEGYLECTSEGNVITPYRQQYTKEQARNVLRSCQLVHGVMVERTENPQDTAQAILELEKWLRKPEHRSLLVRPKRTEWGTRTDRDWAVWLLQGFPGIGPTLAEAIFDHFGEVPLRWTCRFGDLLKVEGIGPKRAAALWRALELPGPAPVGEDRGHPVGGSGSRAPRRPAMAAPVLGARPKGRSRDRGGARGQKGGGQYAQNRLLGTQAPVRRLPRLGCRHHQAGRR